MKTDIFVSLLHNIYFSSFNRSVPHSNMIKELRWLNTLSTALLGSAAVPSKPESLPQSKVALPGSEVPSLFLSHSPFLFLAAPLYSILLSGEWHQSTEITLVPAPDFDKLRESRWFEFTIAHGLCCLLGYSRIAWVILSQCQTQLHSREPSFPWSLRTHCSYCRHVSCCITIQSVTAPFISRGLESFPCVSDGSKHTHTLLMSHISIPGC